VLGIAHSSLYVQCKRPKADKTLAMRIEAAHEKDDTLGHRKLAVLSLRNREASHQARDAQVWHLCPAQTQEVCLSRQSPRSAQREIKELILIG